jgi:hypothetical protein
LAVQLLDILWAPFVLLGIEHVEIVKGFTEANHLNLHHMPYTHSLPMAVFWSLGAGAAYRLINRPAGRNGALLIAALVFSHWILDYFMHKPDLELWFGGPKVGLSLWDNRPLSFAIELGAFAAGVIAYTLKSRTRNALGWISVLSLFSVGIALQVFGNWGPPPPSAQAAALSALIAHALFAGLALFCDRTRKIRID